MLSTYFATKKSAAQKLAVKIESLYDEFLVMNYSVPRDYKLSDLVPTVYVDSDVPKTLPTEKFEFDS